MCPRVICWIFATCVMGGSFQAHATDPNSFNHSKQASDLQLELSQLISETQTFMLAMSQWERSPIQEKILYRLNENLLLLQLAKDMDTLPERTEHDGVFYQEVDNLMEHQVGVLYMGYQVMDFARERRIPFAHILRLYPALKVDLHKALDHPVKMQQAKTLFDRWLYLGLVSLY